MLYLCRYALYIYYTVAMVAAPFSTRRKYKFIETEETARMTSEEEDVDGGMEKQKSAANNNSVRPKASVHSDHVHLFV